jgi:DNA-binding CsgD family transcriptional regulator/PAS domain-containing protein
MAHAPGDRTDWIEVERIYRNDFMSDDPHRLSELRPGESVLTVAASQSPTVRAFLADIGITHSLRACFAEPGGMRCWLDMIWNIPESAAPCITGSLEMMRRLSPHLNRATALYVAMKRQEAERAIYASVVDHFALGCLLLNENGEVIHVNHIAASIIAEWPNVAIVRGRITIAERMAQRELEDAIAGIMAARRQGKAAAPEKLVRVGTPGGRLLGLLVYPAPPARYYRGTQAPSAIVHLSDLSPGQETPRAPRPMPLGKIAQLFGLTRQESTLALLLAHGHTIAESARDMCIAETAARNYSKKVYAKMGVSSQTELVRLMLRSLSFLR